MTKEGRLREVTEHFGIQAGTIRRAGEGHINATWIVTSGKESYICQKLSGMMNGHAADILIRNYQLYEKACHEYGAPDWSWPEWRTDESGQRLFLDNEGDFWRVYPCIPGEIMCLGADPYETGIGLARLHHILKGIRGIKECAVSGYRELSETYRLWEDTFESTVSRNDKGKVSDPKESGKERIMTDERRRDTAEAAQIIREHISDFTGVDFSQDQVIHGDTKQSNAVFSNGRVVAWIDLDTLMYGSRIIDLADAFRSLLKNTDGGRQNGRDTDPALGGRRTKGVPSPAERECMERLLRGYEAGGMSAPDSRELAAALSFLDFELGIRYHTDHLSGRGTISANTPEASGMRALHDLREALRWKTYAQA